ncbi:uncharacterized protein LOC106670816 [Cimex lectularius]|uniref:Uncharacterized protein n=1 Tax=Cimex lectularius TaxID=79782 RepID=A0A8I6TJT3_CIMLE|nr:uncharacterized protein LOC106670816 [Cimex lectularius]
MPPYIRESLNPPMSNKDVLLRAVEQIQEMLPEGYRITIDFYRVDGEDEEAEQVESEEPPKIINADSLDDAQLGEIDFELCSALEQLSVIEDALPFLRGIQESGQRDEIICKLFGDKGETGDEGSQENTDCTLVKQY